MSVLPARALVVGLARSGQAAALALARRGIAVVGADRAADIATGRLAASGVEVLLGREEESLLDGVEVVVKSPGVPDDSPLVAAARRRSVPVWSEVELGFRLLPQPIVGVTGTNGKTTTSELLGEIFRCAGREVAVAGNVGRPLCGIDGRLHENAWIVCELSSFQLEDIDTFRPRVAVLLNFAADHLDRHPSVEAYFQAKLRIFENQTADDWAVIPRGSAWDLPGGAAQVPFDGDDELPAEPRIRGRHNRENAAAATAAARAAGVDEGAIAAGLRSFGGVPHRLELIARIEGVEYVNDSKATNVAAARPALIAYGREPLHLILGGSLKGESFEGLRYAIGPNVKRVYLIGEAAGSIAAALAPAGVPMEHAGGLDAALAAAARAAEPGDVVLLSPACASYDQFNDFEERGEMFRRLVEELRR